MLLNIISNSIKFTDEGGTIILDIDYEQTRLDRYNCTIKVTDNGIGISEDFMGRLFDNQAKMDNSTSKTGLGLHIVKSLIDLMKGTINVKSKLGEGTEITIKLNFKKASMPIPLDSANRYDANILDNKKILVCDDQPNNMMATCSLLKAAGMEVVGAENGFVGIEVFKSSVLREYDCILMDINMPIINGIDACFAIRELERPDAATIPIIAMTENPAQIENNPFLCRYFTSILTKSSGEGSMLKAVALAISKSRLLD